MTPLVFTTPAGLRADLVLVPLPDCEREDDWVLLTTLERERAGRFRSRQARIAFVTTRAVLRRVLAQHVGTAPEALVIEPEPSGRLVLRAPAEPMLDFNVSHTHGLAAIAVMRGGRVGVDIESHGPIAELREIVPTVMGASECALLATLDDGAFQRAFYGSWTRKEAIVKALGDGLSYPVTQLDLPSDAAVVDMVAQTSPAQQWHVFSREPEPGVSLSVAVGSALM